jgi:four helix bundle protein
MDSSNELEYQLLLAFDLGYIESNSYKKLNDELVEIRKMLNSLI